MTYRDMLDACIDFQSEVRIQYYDYDNDELISLTEEEGKDREIKYIYPAGHDAIVIEVYGPDDE